MGDVWGWGRGRDAMRCDEMRDGYGDGGMGGVELSGMS